jgi:hypothetical protein
VDFRRRLVRGAGQTLATGLGRNPDDCKDKKMPLAPMVASLLVALVMSAVLFPVLVSAGALTIVSAAVTGLILGLGFLFCPILVNNMFQQRSFTLTVIDGLHWTFALVIEAVVITLLA